MSIQPVSSLSLELGEGIQTLALGGHPRSLSHSSPNSPPGNSFIRHNAHHLTRVYPLGRRINSANYSPQEMWNAGCQLGEWCSRAGSGQGAAEGWPLGGHGRPQQWQGHAAFQKVEKSVWLRVIIVKRIVSRLCGETQIGLVCS